MKTAIIIAASLFATSAFAQTRIYTPPPPSQFIDGRSSSPSQQNGPPIYRPADPAPIIIMQPPTSGFSESIIINPNGSLTIIQQQGSSTFTTTY